MSDYLSRLAGAADTTAYRRFHNLPVWAAAELNRLARELDDAEYRLTTGEEDSNTWADPYTKTPRPLGRPDGIRHRYPNGVEATVLWERNPGPLVIPEMEVLVAGARPVILLGGAANVVNIRLEHWS